MDPMTMMAVAQVGLGAVQTVWNYFSGQSQLSEAKSRAKKSYNLQKRQVNQQYAQGQTDITVAAGNDQADFASRGIDGGMVDSVVSGQTDSRTTKLNQWRENSMDTLNLNLDNTLSDIQAQGDQLNMNTLMNGLGVGVSAFSSAVDSGMMENGWDWTDMFTGDSYAKRKRDLAAYEKSMVGI